MTVQHLKGLAAIPVGDIKPSPSNPRERLEGIEDLAASIHETGLIQPIVVQQIPGRDHYQIVAGHRRYAAVTMLKWGNVPCIIRRDMLPDEELLAMLVENGQRAALDPIEEARALRQLKTQTGLTDIELGRKVGRSGAYVGSRLILLQLPQEEQEAVRAGHYTLMHAVDLVRTERRKERERANPVARPVGRPRGARTKPYFGDTHRLAKTARGICAANGHGKGHVKVGGVACGPCWELVIRADAEPSRAEPSRAEPSRAEPSRAEPGNHELIDEAVVLRALNGDKSVLMGRRNRAERAEVVRRAIARGWSYRDIEQITGVTKPERYRPTEQAS